MSTNYSPLPEDSLRFVQALWRPDEVREVRVLRCDRFGRTASGYFDTPEKLVEAAAAWEGKANVYITVNATDPTLLARADNRIVAPAQSTTADAEIARRTWLFLDIDSVRPSGISATEAELAEAEKVLNAVTGYLAGLGWPPPMSCLSGNGYYALFPIELPNTAETRSTVQKVLETLAQRFNTAAATIDTTVANASRIACLIGTTKRKGDPTAERPHRRSRLLNVPAESVPVPLGLLESLVGDRADSRRTRVTSPEMARPLAEILEAAGVDYREQQADLKGNVWYHVRACPFHGPDHPYECGVGQALDGRYLGKCFHPEGVGKGWREWKRALGLQVGRNKRRNDVASASVRGSTTGADTEQFALELNRTDAGNAELFAELYGGRLRFDHRRGAWFVRDEHHWRDDADGQVYRLAIDAARQRYQAAPRIADLDERDKEAKFAIGSENRTRLEAMLALGRRMIPLATAGDDWNRDPLLLGVGNGVIELGCGKLRAGQPQDMINFFTDVAYDPVALCPRWQRFLLEVFQGDEELVDWIWRLIGYLLTGLTSEQCFCLLYGRGANGKSSFLNVLCALLGRYAFNAPFATFEAQARAAIPNDLAAMVDRRLVTSSETSEQSRLNEARMKMLTGGDPVTARFLNHEFFTFTPVAKFMLAVNHKPHVRDYSMGFWRRLRLIPFEAQFQGDAADRELDRKLLAELPGVLAWAVRGCLEWQQRPLGKLPRAVEAATDSYRADSDPLADFIAQRCLPEKGGHVKASVVRDAYCQWAQEEGLTDDERLSGNRFYSVLESHFRKQHTKTGNLYLGLRLCDPARPTLEDEPGGEGGEG